jgi:hypothetical protein
MIISDYSNQEPLTNNRQLLSLIPELLTAGLIFILPIIFLLVISAN